MTADLKNTSRLTRVLRQTAIAGLLTLPLSACAVYPAPPPDGYYEGGACCYSYYEYPGYYPYAYEPVIGFHYYGGGYRRWR